MFLKITVVATTLATLTACGGSGLCEGTGGIVDECFEGWTRDECEEWDDESVNGASWTWHASGSCEDRGYSVDCDGAWLQSSSDCYY
jgi:hypothetical protein